MDESRAPASHRGLAGRWLAPLSLLVLAVAIAVTGRASVRAGALAPSFALVSQHGEMTRLDELRGQTVLLTFLYTSCPDTCPLYLANVAASVHTIGENGSDVPAVVVVTVDPDRDTVERLRAFAAAWPSDWLFLTGTYQQVSAAWQSYGIVAEKRPLANSSDVHAHHGYAVVHSAKLFVIDPSGQRQAELTGEWTAQELTMTLAATRAPLAGLADGGFVAALGELLRRCGELAATRPGLVLGLLAFVTVGALLVPALLLRTFLNTRTPATDVLVQDHPSPSVHDPAC